MSILLATFNGAAYLPQQLKSLKKQNHRRWTLILSDDGSSDETLNIARAEIAKPQLQIFAGPQRGLTQNFWNALMRAPDGNFAAFCDQDDVWCPDKLSRALSGLSHFQGAALYSSGRFICDQSLNVHSVQPRNPEHRLLPLPLRNHVAGHTCVINPKAVQILKRAPPPADVPFHDWWAALALEQSNATFVHDPTPTLYYRQHRTNVLGARGGRLKRLFNGTYLKWIHANLKALRQLRHQQQADRDLALGVCLPSQAGLSVKREKQGLKHARQPQQQTRRRGVFNKPTAASGRDET